MNETVSEKVPEAAPRRKLTFALTLSQVAVAAGCAIALVAFVVVAARRVRYPFELEWLESEMLQHVRRLVDGQPLYTSPSIFDTELPYAPLMFGFGAALAEITGVHFWMMRAVSIAATLGTIAVIAMIVWKETRSRFAAIVAAGIYVASFRVTGAFYDVGKADPLFIFFSVVAIGFARDGERRRNAILAGVFMALAILTKQTALFFFVPIAVWLLVTRWRFGAWFGAITLAVAGAVTLVLHVASDGWYTFFVWELLFGHAVVESSRVTFFTEDLKPYWPALVVVLCSAPLWFRKDNWRTVGFYAAVFAGLIAGAWTGRLHSGGYDNVLMPAAVAISLVAGVAVAYATAKPARPFFAVVAIAMCALQLHQLRYDISEQIPTAADEASGRQLLAAVRSVDGDVWFARHPEYASMVGKGSYAGQGGIEDIFRGQDGTAKRDLAASIGEAIHTQRFAMIVLDGPDDTRGFPTDWQRYYQRDPALELTDDGTFHPVVNKTGRPSEFWVRRDVVAPAP